MCTGRKLAFKDSDTQYSMISDKEYTLKNNRVKIVNEITLEGLLRLLLQDLSQFPKMVD